MAKAKTLTTDQWLADLEAAVPLQQRAEGLSTRDVGEALGLCQETARLRVQRAVRSGKWEKKGDRAEVNMGGRACRVPVYGPVKGGK